MPEDPTMLLRLIQLGGSLEKHELTLLDTAIGNLPEIARISSGIVSGVVICDPDGKWADRHIAQLERFSNLDKLTILGGERLTDESLLYVSKFSALKTLDLSTFMSNRVTPLGFRQLGRLQNAELIKFGSAAWGSNNPIVVDLQRRLPNTIIST